MPLSPKDIEQKTFTASFRGYAEDEVDAFLEEVIGSIEAYQQMIRERDARIAQLEAGHVMAPIGLQPNLPDEDEDAEVVEEPTVPLPPPPSESPSAQPPPPPAPVVDESAVSRALIVAQRTADQMVEEANVEAERIVARARRRAVEFEAEDASRRQAVIDGYLGLRGELAGLRSRFSDSFGATESTFRSLESEVEEFLAKERPAKVPNPTEVADVPTRSDGGLVDDADAGDTDPAEDEGRGEELTDRRPWER